MLLAQMRSASSLSDMAPGLKKLAADPTDDALPAFGLHIGVMGSSPAVKETFGLLADKGRRKEVFDLLGTRCGDNILDG